MGSEEARERGFGTLAVHAGERPAKPDFIPTATPIYLSTSFSYDGAATSEAVFGNERPGYVYTRYGNPTTRALETAIAALEGTDEAVAFASGMAAIHNAVLNEVKAGSRIVAARELYGASSAVLVNLFSSLDVETTFVDVFDLAATAAVVEEIRPRVLFFETVSNPLVRVADIHGLAEIARRVRATVIVDNTFASPLLVNPIRHGAHVVVHSTTKYLGGHGDVTGGAVATDADRAYDLRELAKLTGGIAGPFESWLTLRGIKTLPLRVKQQSENAAAVARWLSAHPRIARVHYPEQADLGAAADQFNSGLRGGMLAFEIAGAGCAEAHHFLDALRLCVPASTLGDVFTLVLYPPMSSHRGMEPEERAAIGIGDGLLRLSVGIENVEDIIADLDQALEAVDSSS
ncbi:MAG TPA: PLP-dependent aspartate aminotransferase family protein [Thermomicrobiales bacterium]|jgi:cystathionine gamma-synthase/methionine-gamma-lyase